jgi:hypothetical protein
MGTVVDRVSEVAPFAPVSAEEIREWYGALSEVEVALIEAWSANLHSDHNGSVEQLVANCTVRRERWAPVVVSYDEPGDILLSELCELVAWARAVGQVGELTVGLARSWTGSVCDLVSCGARLEMFS